MKNWILIVAGIFVTTFSFSQGSISGIVLDESTGESLPFANVRLEESN